MGGGGGGGWRSGVVSVVGSRLTHLRDRSTAATTAAAPTPTAPTSSGPTATHPSGPSTPAPHPVKPTPIECVGTVRSVDQPDTAGGVRAAGHDRVHIFAHVQAIDVSTMASRNRGLDSIVLCEVGERGVRGVCGGGPGWSAALTRRHPERGLVRVKSSAGDSVVPLIRRQGQIVRRVFDDCVRVFLLRSGTALIGVVPCSPVASVFPCSPAPPLSPLFPFLTWL